MISTISGEFLTNFVACFYHIFINFVLLGWVRNGHDIVNPFVDCELYVFCCFDIFGKKMSVTCNKQDCLLYIAY